MQHARWLTLSVAAFAASLTLIAQQLLAQNSAEQNSAAQNSSPQTPLHTADAVFANAQLTNLDANGKWTFQVTASGGRESLQQTLDTSNMIRWGGWSGVTQKSAVWLSDGSWIVGRVEFDSAQELTLHSEWFKPAKIPLRAVRGLVMVAPASIAAWNQLHSQMEATTGGRDTIWLTGNRQIAGVLRLALDEFDRSPKFVLENAGQALAVDSNEVRAIVFSPTLLGAIPVQSKQSVLGLTDGSRLNIRKLSSEGSQVQVTLSDGFALQSLDARGEFCRGVACLTNRPANTSFLADLEPASYKHIPQSQLNWPLGRNRDLLVRPLMTSLGIMDRGLATHSTSQVAYRLSGNEQRLLAEVQFAKPAEGANEQLGSVNCQVLVARSGKLQPLTEFHLDRSRSEPHLLNLDITGSQLLVLVTDQADFAQYGDHILWLDARILAKP